MAQPPCSPWRVAEGDDQPDAPGFSPYTGTALDLDAPLLRSFAVHDVYPDQIDEWENWQAAEVLEGLLDKAHARHSGQKGTYRPRTARATGASPVRSARDILAERVAAHREGRPAPTADEASGVGVAPLITRFGPQAVLHVGADIAEPDAPPEPG